MNEMNFEINLTDTENTLEEKASESVFETEETAKEPTFSEAFENDLLNGFHSVLYKRINSVSITDVRMKDAFGLFLNTVDCAETISVAEIIYSAEAVIHGKLPNDHCENRIYVCNQQYGFTPKVSSKLLANTVNGFYALPNLRNGFALDLSFFGGDLNSLATKRFIVASEKQMKKLFSEAARSGINCVSVGSMLSSEQIVLTNCGDTVAVFDKEKINRAVATESVCLGSEVFADFLNGFNSVASYALSDSLSPNNLLHFSLSGSFNSIFARALGYFAAMMQFKVAPINLCFSSDSESVVAVPRPFIAEGTYLYLLKIRNDANGMPDKLHLEQLKMYLSEKKRYGIIKDVLPLRKNVSELINALGGDKLDYIPLAPIEDDRFGIIVSVSRGENLNGIRLGYFINKE